MATLVQPRELARPREAIPFIAWLLFIFTVFGVGLAIYRLVAGLGATTNLNDHYPWGLWITIDLFLIPVAGAAFTISLISYFLGREDYHAVIRPAVLAGIEKGEEATPAGWLRPRQVGEGGLGGGDGSAHRPVPAAVPPVVAVGRPVVAGGAFLDLPLEGRGGRGGGGGPIGPDLLIKDGGGGIFRGNWPHATSSRVGGLRIENTSAPGKIYQMSVEHHNIVEAQFHNVQNWEFYALQTEEENPAGHEAISLEIRNCRNLLFANTYIYRVSRITLPKTYAVMVRNSDNIRFENVKVFSQTRLAFDNAVLDEDSGVAVRPQFFTNFIVKKGMKTPTAPALPAVFDKGATLEKLAGGFSNASGLTTDDAGHLFFTDAAMRKIYRWNEVDKKAEQIAETQGQPMVMGFAQPSSLLIVAYEKAVYSLNLEEKGATPQPVTETTEKSSGTLQGMPQGSAQTPSKAQAGCVVERP